MINPHATINIYTIAWNEEFMLPHFLKHYESVANKIFVLDHHSTDRTAEIAKAHKKVRYSIYDYPTYNEKEISDTFVKMAKRHRSTWAVCVDTDEFIYGLESLLFESPGILKPTGYMMIGSTGRLEDCKKVRMESFDKPVIFDPRIKLRFNDGRHSVVSDEAVRRSGMELWHYKYPSRKYYLERNKAAYPRIMNEKDTQYRLRRGLEWYDEHI